MRNWQTEDGLPDNTVSAIQQTTDGYLWVGTCHNGLARFDGVQFRTFDAINTPELRSSRILSLMAGPANTLWIGTEGGGLLKMSGGRFESVPLAGFGASETISSLFRGGDGALWILVAGKGVACLKNGQVRTFSETNELAGGKLPDAGGDLAVQAWLSARNNLLNIHGDIWHIGSGQAPHGSDFIAVQRSRDGSVWTASVTGLKKLTDPNGASGKASFPLGRALESAWSQVTFVSEDREGRLWIGTTYTGLFCSTKPGEFTRVKSEGPLSQHVVSAIYEEQNGLIWAGTYGTGLFRIKRKMVTSLVPPGVGESLMHSCCAARDGSVWMGTSTSGVYRYADGRFSHYTSADGLTSLEICAVFEDSRTNLWVATLDGLFHLKENRFEKVSGPANLPRQVLSIYEDRSGALWFGCNGGIARRRGDEWTLFTVRDGLSHPDVRGFAEDAAGGLWIATEGGGLDRLKDDRFTHFGDEAEFPYKFLMSLLVDSDGVLWIGTLEFGLVRFKDGKFTTYTTQDGLAANLICGIAEDTLGNLWLGSINGLLCVSKRALNEYERGVGLLLPCLRLSTGDGMASPTCSVRSQNSMARTADGRLWVPNWHAVAVVDPRRVLTGAATTSVVVEEILIDGRDYPSSSTGSLRVPFGRKRFEFHFTTLGLPAAETARFRHQLEGLDSDWVDDGARRQAYYGQLAPGRYRFRVIAAGDNGVWREAAAPLTLEIVPHFWELRWFQVLAGMVFVGAAAGVIVLNQRRRHRHRLQRIEMQRALETERGRIARDIHDELGAGLTQIMLVSELGQSLARQPAEAELDFGKIARNTRQAVQALDEIVWAVNPKNDNLPRLVRYICRFADECFEASGIRCWQKISDDLPTLAVCAEVRHNLFLAVKEALNNVLKHSHATEVWLRIGYSEQTLRVEIEDNGRGFAVSEADLTRSGLKNMKTRLLEVGGLMDIESAPQRHTCVRLELPLKVVPAIDTLL